MGSIKIIQVNLHHAKGASATLVKRFAEDNLAIGLIQEPWVAGGRIRGLSLKSCKLIYDNSESKPRAAIWVDTTIKYFPIPEFINKDLVTIMVESLTDGGTQEVICASAYFPGDSECVPPACV